MNLKFWNYQKTESYLTKIGAKAQLLTMYKKIGQKVHNRKVCVYLPSRQIFKFGIIKKKEDN
jgi:hypothetical protein